METDLGRDCTHLVGEVWFHMSPVKYMRPGKKIFYRMMLYKGSLGTYV